MKNGNYYEEQGDKLFGEKRYKEAERAYLHAMDDFAGAITAENQSLDNYKRVLHKHISTLEKITGNE